MSKAVSKSNRWLYRFEGIIVGALQLLLILLIASGTLALYALFFRGIRANLTEITSTEDLHGLLQKGFGGVLIILLGLELIETLKTYFSEHLIRLEVILIVAIIAVGREIIKVDYDHASWPLLFGLSSLVISLAVGYFLVRTPAPEAEARQEESTSNRSDHRLPSE